MKCTAKFRKNPPTRRQALSTFPWTSKMCLPPGRGLTASLASGRRSGFSSTSWTSLSTPARLRWPILDVPVPMKGDQLVDVLRFFDTLCPVAEQVIAVPKTILEDIPVRTLVREPQVAEQLVDEPVPSFDDFDLVEEEEEEEQPRMVPGSRVVDAHGPFLVPGCGPGGSVLVDDRHIHCTVHPPPDGITARPGRYTNTGQRGSSTG